MTSVPLFYASADVVPDLGMTASSTATPDVSCVSGSSHYSPASFPFFTLFYRFFARVFLVVVVSASNLRDHFKAGYLREVHHLSTYCLSCCHPPFPHDRPDLFFFPCAWLFFCSLRTDFALFSMCRTQVGFESCYAISGRLRV